MLFPSLSRHVWKSSSIATRLSLASHSKGMRVSFSSLSSRTTPQLLQQQQQNKVVAVSSSIRGFSSSPDDRQTQFKARPPKQLTLEMAEGIQNANKLILKYGVGQQRLQLLAESSSEGEDSGDDNTNNFMPLVLKWQRMMEIYLGAQLHVVAALGYETNEQGIMMYTQQLSQFMATCDVELQDRFRKIGRDTWREMLATAFDLDDDLLQSKASEELSIVDARNTVHKVASRLMEPNILEAVATRCAEIPAQSDPQMDLGMKHQIIQDVVVNQVYLGGSPSLVEELGFGSGAKGYALMQYVMAYHETDPLCMQYTRSAMMKIWKAAGLDLSNQPGGVTSKMPLSAPPS